MFYVVFYIVMLIILNKVSVKHRYFVKYLKAFTGNHNVNLLN